MAKGGKPRVFLDTNIFIRGVTFPRFPYEILRHALKGDIQAVTSELVLASARHYISASFPQFGNHFEAILSTLGLEIVADPEPDEVHRRGALVRDARDVPVAVAAIEAKVDYLVSTDSDFTDDDESTAELRRYVRVLRPGAFLRLVCGWDSERLTAIERRRWADLGRPRWTG